MNNRKKILFLSRWYPHRYDAMSGLFVRKHAQALALYADVCVLFLLPDSHVKNFEIIEQQSGKVREIYVYFPFFKNKIFKRITKAINFWRAFHKGYKQVLKTYEKPDICQVNTLTRCGCLAYYLKKKQKIPYIIVEHWTRYLPKNKTYRGILRKKITEFVVKEARFVLPVSKDLKQAMQDCGLKSDNYKLIDNVVDDFFYEKQETNPHEKIRILHISCFDESAKNVFGILRTIKKVSLQRNDFELIIIGNGQDFEKTVAYSKSLGLGSNIVQFLGEKTPQEVCNYFYQSDFFVLFSNRENAPVVLSESLAVGCPIITTNVGGISEMMTPDTGIMIAVGDEDALYEKILWMLNHFQDFNSEKIREIGKKYTYEKVGKYLYDIHCQV